MSEIEDKLISARARLLRRQPFFGCLSLYLIPEEDPSIGTAGTDGKGFYYNPAFIEAISPEEVVGVWSHEILHAALGHVFSYRIGHRQMKKWNMACDYVINLIIQDVIQETKDKGIKLPAGVLLDESFRGMSAEEVYNLLPDEDEDGGSQPLGGDIREAKGSESEQKVEAREWVQRVSQTRENASQRGSIPLGLQRFIGELLEPILPWEQILSQMVSENVRDDYDMLLMDRRFLYQGFGLPDVHREQLKAVIAFDTSGSMSKEELQEALTEAWSILRSRDIAEIRLMASDAKVYYDEVFRASDEPPAKLPGGGGTSFVPVFQRLEEEAARPSCLIYFTDLDGAFPKDPPSFPTIWITKSNQEAPFGRTIKYR